ncbi:MAG: MFS transporter [Thermoguttaceae bacterium]
MDRLCHFAALGTCFLVAAVVPLMKMPAVDAISQANRRLDWKAIARPLGDGRFWRLLIFGCWFSLSNGLTQTVQFSYGGKVLNISLLAILILQTGMRLGQLSVSPALGRAADLFGNRALMIVCLLLTAQGPLFYFFSTPQEPWWFVGAWIVWIAYAGLNIGLPNLMLKLSPRQSNTPYIALYFTLTGLCYALNTILGGWLFDCYGHCEFNLFGSVIDYNRWMFLIGWMARCSGLLALLLVIEPRKGERH